VVDTRYIFKKCNDITLKQEGGKGRKKLYYTITKRSEDNIAAAQKQQRLQSA
jgi:hypothetical protein